MTAGPSLRKVLAKRYEPRPAPNSVDRLDIGDYTVLVTHPDLRGQFQQVYGPNVELRLQRLSDLRNGLFHFRQVLTPSEVLQLEDMRRFFRMRAERAARLAAGSAEGAAGTAADAPEASEA